MTEEEVERGLANQCLKNLKHKDFHISTKREMAKKMKVEDWKVYLLFDRLEAAGKITKVRGKPCILLNSKELSAEDYKAALVKIKDLKKTNKPKVKARRTTALAHRPKKLLEEPFDIIKAGSIDDELIQVTVVKGSVRAVKSLFKGGL